MNDERCSLFIVHRSSFIVHRYGCALARLRWSLGVVWRRGRGAALSPVARRANPERVWPCTCECARGGDDERWRVLAIELVARAAPAPLVQLAGRWGINLRNPPMSAPKN